MGLRLQGRCIIIIDSNYLFSGASLGNTATGQAITSTAASTNIVDLTGAGSGNAPLNRIGNASVFGQDLGIGDGPASLHIDVWITTSFVSAGGATMQVQFQGAIDNGSNAPSTYTTYTETDALTVAQLTRSLVIPEANVIRLWWPHRAIQAAMPRFIRLNYVVATSTFSAGAVAAGLVMQQDEWAAGLYPANYVVA